MPDKPTVSLDYAFLGANRAGNREERLAEEENAVKRGHTPVMVMHDSGHKGIYAYAIPSKEKGLTTHCAAPVWKILTPWDIRTWS